MVVDTSAVLAIALDEPERCRFEDAIERDATRLISAASALEAMIVLMRRAGPEAAAAAVSVLGELIGDLELDVEPVNPGLMKHS